MFGLRLALILSALASANGHTRGAAQWEDENSLVAGHRDVTRKLMKDKSKKNLTGGGGNKNNNKGGGGKDRQPNNGGGGGGDNTGGGQYVAEDHDCVPFNEEIQGRASLSLSDDACRTNSCGGGCCRIYHWLICDTSDEMPQLSCVCNENTKPLATTPPTDPPTPFPTPAPQTAVPTPDPTAFVTSDVKDSDGLTTPPPAEPSPTTQTPATPQPTPAPVTPANPVTPTQTEPEFIGGAASDSCASGSPHHNNPLFRGFTKCFAATDCPLATECCIHSFCFCGEPDQWTGDCVERIAK